MTYAIVRQSDLQTIELFPQFAREASRDGVDDGQDVALQELDEEYFEEITNARGIDLL